MARSKKAAASAAANPGADEPGTIFDHFAAQNPDPAPAAKSEVDVDALLKQIATLNDRVDRAEKTNAALMAAPPSPATTYQPAQPQWGALPDPVMEREAFDKALADRISGAVGAALQHQNAQRQQHQAQNDQVEFLWEKFTEKYPELAKHERLVQVAGEDVAREMQRRGVDLGRYMFGATDQFLDDVAGRMKKDYGALVETDEGDEPLKPARQKLTEAAPNRTVGLFGGADSGGKPAAPAEAKPGSMVKDLQDFQRKDGYY